MTKFEKIFAEFVAEMNRGVEYPDAHTNIIVKYNLSDKLALRITEWHDEGYSELY